MTNRPISYRTLYGHHYRRLTKMTSRRIIEHPDIDEKSMTILRV